MILKIITLNTWQEFGPWRDRWEIIFENLPIYNPDIVGFQEVFSMPFADEIKERSGYPYLVKSGQHSGLIFISKYPVVESECLTYKTKSPQEDYLRYALYALFDVGGKRLAGLNTHLSWKLSDDQIRSNQIAELLDFVIKKIPTHPGQTSGVDQGWGPAFMLGDFNSEANKPAIRAVLETWEDTYAFLHPAEAGLTWNYQNPFAERARDRMPERRLDYIFCSKTLKKAIRTSKVVFDQPNGQEIYPSDHFGVMTEIEW